MSRKMKLLSGSGCDDDDDHADNEVDVVDMPTSITVSSCWNGC